VRTQGIYPLSDAQVTAVARARNGRLRVSPLSGEPALGRESASAIRGDGWSPAGPWDEAERVTGRIGVDVFAVEFPGPEG